MTIKLVENGKWKSQDTIYLVYSDSYQETR